MSHVNITPSGRRQLDFYNQINSPFNQLNNPFNQLNSPFNNRLNNPFNSPLNNRLNSPSARSPKSRKRPLANHYNLYKNDVHKKLATRRVSNQIKRKSKQTKRKSRKSRSARKYRIVDSPLRRARTRHDIMETLSKQFSKLNII